MNEKSKNPGGKKADPAEDSKKITDPQESMQGPVSSVIQKIKEGAEKNDEKEKEEHGHKKSHTGGDFINK
ncbi:MAG TPA: hypothetical protein VFE32_21360 [Puia sp.]|jgi:hypothetical protein|nr:hypothetical protein [Puia sp.]